MYPFPHFRYFTFGTPTIPDIYWNSYSYEERIKKLCMEYAKLIVFTDSMVDTVNDQYKIIEDMKEQFPELVNEETFEILTKMIEDGELQPIVQEAIDIWMNERSAQVDANTQAIAAETLAREQAIAGEVQAREDGIASEAEAREQAINEVDSRVDSIDEYLIPLTETTQLEYDSDLKSYVAFKNDAYQDDAGTRVYIVPKAHVEHGTGGCLKIFADDYPTANYRDLGIYYSADQEGETGHNNAGVFWINTKHEGFDTNSDIGFCFNDGQKIVGRLIDGPHTPFVYVGNGTPTFINPSGSVYYKMQVDGNFLVKNPYRLFIGTGNSIFENTDGGITESCTTKKIFAGGNEVINVASTGMTFSQNIYFDSNVHNVVMKSPDGVKWKLNVDNSGNLSTVRID